MGIMGNKKEGNSPIIGNYKKNETPIINYEGPNDIFVWKHPVEDFYTGAQLIVHESQEALFFRNGQALDLFGSGRHVLETENLPLLNRILRKPFGDRTPFHAEVYYINKVVCMDILWGTAQPVLVQDPVYNIILPVRANGQFAIRVVDSRKLLLKLVGTINGFSKDTLVKYFRGMLMTRIRDLIAKKMVQDKLTFMDIQANLNDISDSLKMQMTPEFEEYGIELVNFFTNAITIPEDNEDYVRIRKALAGAKERELLAQGKRAEMDIMGYTYQQKRTFDVLDRAASNEGPGSGLMNAGMGMTMGMGMGGMLGGAMGSAMQNNYGVNLGMPQQPQQPAAHEAAKPCSKCGAPLPNGAKFCLECGEKVVNIQEGYVVCPKCGQQVPKAKFCLECGNLMVSKCPECGSELPNGAKFCLECGHRI
ncbi:MAG: SPFH domain-containing protein [Ruminococcaceae bacterium]|nr:SPFH domain-containing protein [Oscillospiraceae bacterium]